MPIYTNIKKTCKQKGISVTKLEADLGFARSTIYKWDTHQPGIGKDQRSMGAWDELLYCTEI